VTLCSALGSGQAECLLSNQHFLPMHWHFLAIWFASGYCCNARLMAKKKKNPAAVALGRKGGKASARRLTREQRTEKARKAAKARWNKAG
jgi:hypothetical protein